MKKTGRQPTQSNLFQDPALGSLNLDIRLRMVVSGSIRKSGKDRFDICAEMSKLTGVEVSKHSLDAWSAESRAKSGDNQDFNGNKRWGMPAELIPAFCQATGYWEAMHLVVEIAKYKAVPGDSAIRYKLSKLDEKLKKLEAQKTRLKKDLAECLA